MASAADVVGWYDLSWAGGSFPICFRPGGCFFCPSFQAPARWVLEEGVVKIDWAKFGKYELKFDPESKSMEGNAIPLKEDDPNNWRKAAFKSELSPAEALLIGDGAGTEWDFEWSGGSFKVRFKADGYNHFQCPDFPAHAHWTLTGNTLKINWAEYGNYTMEIDAAASAMAGGQTGQDWSKDDMWRKAKNPEKLMDQKTLEHCEHHH